jgi:hypothetical protein
MKARKLLSRQAVCWPISDRGCPFVTAAVSCLCLTEQHGVWRHGGEWSASRADRALFSGIQSPAPHRWKVEGPRAGLHAGTPRVPLYSGDSCLLLAMPGASIFRTQDAGRGLKVPRLVPTFPRALSSLNVLVVFFSASKMSGLRLRSGQCSILPDRIQFIIHSWDTVNTGLQTASVLSGAMVLAETSRVGACYPPTLRALEPLRQGSRRPLASRVCLSIHSCGFVDAECPL